MEYKTKLKCSSKECLFTTLFFNKLLAHYRNVHSFHHDFVIHCNFDGCLRSFSNVKSFQKHVQRKHREKDLQNSETQNGGIDLTGGSVVETETEALNKESEGNVENVQSVSDHCNSVSDDCNLMDYNYDERLATFLVTMQEQYKVPYSALSYFTHEIKSWTEINNEHFEQRIKVSMQTSGEEQIDLRKLRDEQNYVSAAAAERLSSKWKVDNYLRDHMSSYVEPVEIILQKSDLGQKHTMQYVPILDNLKSLLKHEDVLAQILDSKDKSNLLSDFCDGDLFSKNQLFANDPHALQIQLYCDDFTVVNPLGAPGRVREFKITAFYFLLGNLDPKYRSQLDMIQLVALVKATDVKKFGLEKVIQPLLEDIYILETEGISIKYEGRNLHFNGSISFIASDNLGAHFLGGFQENFSTTKRGCRFCTASRKLWQGDFNDKFPWRSQEAYDKQARDVTSHVEDPSTYGIKRLSPFNRLKYYHVINGLPSDIAHDVFEGVVPTYLEEIIGSLVHEGFFTISQLNEEIRTFPYCATDKANKPPFMHSSRPKCTQSQMLCFVRLLPLYVGHYVPADVESWTLLGEMLDMVEMICAHHYSQGDLPYMHSLIKEFLEHAHSLYPGIKTKPKSHFLSHYAKETKLFGPLVHCWTLRFEAKHSYFKEICQRSKNHRNVCKTMAERHQRKQAMVRTDRNFLPGHRVTIVRDKECHIELLNHRIQTELLRFGERSDIISECSSVKIEGKLYTTDLAVVIDRQEDDHVFGCIVNIFIVQGSPLLCCKLQTVLQYDSHYHAYEVEDSGNYRILRNTDLADIHPVGCYHLQGKRYITLKHFVTSTR